MTAVRDGPARPDEGDAAALVPPKRGDWRRRYAAALIVTDALSIVCVVFGTQLAWLWLSGDVSIDAPTVSQYTTFSALLTLGWLAALAFNDTRDARVLASGWDEYRRVVGASVTFFGVLAIAAVAFRAEIARPFVLIALPAGVVVLTLTRWLWRQWVDEKRQQGEYVARVLLVGTADSARDVVRQLSQAPPTGLVVAGACLPPGDSERISSLPDIPVLGDLDDVSRVLSRHHIDTVLVTGTESMPASRVREISWSLEAGRQHLVIAPSLADIAGPRIRIRPVAGVPLLHVETPRFSRGQQFVKRSSDIVSAVCGLIVLSPLLIALMLIVRAGSPGPALFRQTRIGRGGRPFTMYKFRSMEANAEARLDSLRSQADAGNGVMFKMRDDPRVTRVGRFMRRYSLDELPQLFNVIRGEMSMVGPRPSLPREVEHYADHVHRRFLVRPGITGLWQVSGRSTLSWDDTVRLDLSYVDNWSLVSDLGILLKTGRAVLSPGDTAA